MAHASEFAARWRHRTSWRGAIERDSPPCGGVEPSALRTFTPSLAVIDRSAGSLSLDPRGADAGRFQLGRAGGEPGAQSGALVAARASRYLGMWDFKQSGEFFPAAPLTAYNAITELERAPASD